MNQSLLRALRLSPSSVVALVGAGGKTTALYQLGKEYRQTQASVVLLTTTTHLGYEQALATDQHIIHQGNLEATLKQIRSAEGLICLTGEWDEETQRWKGIEPEHLQPIAGFMKEQNLPLLIEADGARGRLLKAPAAHEPLIPDFCEHVVVVAGLTAIGKPLSEAWVHRPKLFAELSGIEIHATISSEAVHHVLCHPLGGRKNIPATARSHVLLTHAETTTAQADAKKLCLPFLRLYDSVVVVVKEKTAPLNVNSQDETPLASGDFQSPYRLVAVHEPIAGVVLAAGASSRFGKPKPLLLWQGETLVRRAARLALETNLQPVIVVCGAEGEQVAASLQDLPVQIVQNDDWQQGQSTSIKAALGVLGDSGGGAIFLLVDQPFISQPLLRALVERHAQTLAAIVAPIVGDRRTNPVLFDRETFADLSRIEGDVGGRAIFARYQLEWLLWHDEKLPFDLDTPQDYQKLLEQDESNA